MEVVSSKQKFDLEETELRLGLPNHVGNNNNNNNNNNNDHVVNCNGKRVFSDTTVDLKLNLNSSKETSIDPKHKQDDISCTNNDDDDDDLVKPPAKAQVVGWPPVRNFRKNILAVQKNNSTDETTDNGGDVTVAVAGALVKVSMDGAPYLRKVDLKMYKSYKDLSDALSKMFNLFTTSDSEAKGMINFMQERKLMDLLNSSGFVPTYEDKDGDWMLIGDVPWEMFVESCKRLRIMKGAEAAGLAPRAMEKCKIRS